MRTTRAIFGLLAVGLVIIVVESFNAWYGQSFGKTEIECVFLGAAAFSIGLFKCITPFFLSEAYEHRQPIRWLVLAAVLTLCIGFSHSSSIGIIAERRLDKAAQRGATVEGKELNAKRLADAEANYQAVKSARPVSVVDADIKAANMDYALTWQKRTEKVATLQTEMATSKAKAEIEKSIESLRNTQASSVSLVKDPQAHTLSMLYGGKEEYWEVGLVYLVSWLLEIISAFGLYMIFGRKKQDKAVAVTESISYKIDIAPAQDVPALPEPIAAVIAEPEAAEAVQSAAPSNTTNHPVFEMLVTFQDDCIEEDADGKIGAQELYDAYCKWHAHTAYATTVLDRVTFGTLMGHIFARCRDHKRAYYTGIRVKDLRSPKTKPGPPHAKAA